MSRPDDPLSERAQHLLKVLVERFIQDGQPVGSRVLARDSGLELSSASIRNVMADLEDLGFIHSPHTSAGRVPTIKGYRFFVDTLLTVKPLRGREFEDLKRGMGQPVSDSKALLQMASDTLSGLTHMAGIVTVPRRENRELKHIEFLQLSEQRVLAIMVYADAEVQNRIIPVNRDFGPTELQQASNFINAKLAGKDLYEVRRRLLAELAETQQDMTDTMRQAVRMAGQALAPQAPGLDDHMVVAGQTNLMDFAELSDVQKLRDLFEAFNNKHDLLHLLDRCMAANGVQIFIGDESGYKVLDECSIVTAPYQVDDQVIGVLGIIGPTRMAYERVIPIVDVTARLLSAALNSNR